MDNHSLWEKGIKEHQHQNQKLNQFQTDILIIGGGITGITTAYFLMNSSQNVMLIDKSEIGRGATSKTTAKLNYLQGIIYQKLEKNFDTKISKNYFDSQIEAIELVKKIVKKEKINCDLEQCDSFIFTKEEKGIPKIEKEKNILESWGIPCETVQNLPLPFPIRYGMVVHDTYTFHPLKYLLHLKKIIQSKIPIYEGVIAYEITPQKNHYLVKTNQGNILARQVVVACHYPFFLFPSMIPIKTYIKREYVNASKVSFPYHFTAISIDSNLHSIRFYKNYFIYGSHQHRLTNQIAYHKNYEKSKSDFQRFFSTEPEYTWMNQDIMSNDDLPIIGEIKNHPGLYLATAYNAWGMTNGTIAGKVICDLILKKPNSYIDLFQPNRFHFVGLFHSTLGAFHYAKIYLQTMIQKNPVFESNSVYVVKINGKYYGVYYDETGQKHIVSHQCPHMKCNLVFNLEEKTWDCPCHGSRFDIDGNVLEGPANYSIGIDWSEKKADSQ